MNACLEVEIDCECGTRLRVYYHSEPSPLPAFQSDESIRCSGCGKNHGILAKPVCLFGKQGEEVWKVQPLR
jgi:hypothetical protein